MVTFPTLTTVNVNLWYEGGHLDPVDPNCYTKDDIDKVGEFTIPQTNKENNPLYHLAKKDLTICLVQEGDYGSEEGSSKWGWQSSKKDPLSFFSLHGVPQRRFAGRRRFYHGLAD
jgi:hypothetical protein